MPHHRHFGEDLRPIPDQRGSFHRGRDLSVLDEVGFAGGEHEFPVGDINLPTAERDGIQPFFHRPDDVLRIRFPGQHESIRHPRKHHALVILTPTVAGQGNPHEAGVELIGDIPAKDTLFDERRAAGRRSFIVHIQRAAAKRKRSIIDDRTDVRRHAFPDQIREGRCFFPVEIGFQAMPDRFVQQNTGPSAGQHNGHHPGRRIHCG